MSAGTAEETVLFWGLACIRLIALFIVSPPFAQPAITARVRIAFSLACAFVLVPPPAASLSLADATLVELGGRALGEVLVGAALGFAVRLAVSAFAVLGELLSVQGGLGAATLIDPMSGASTAAMSALLELFAIQVFFAVEGHHALLRAAAQSFVQLPVGAGGPELDAFRKLTSLGASMFETGLRLAAPVTAATLCANLALGVLGRVVPQLNLMLVQMPAYVALTFAVLLIGVGSLVDGTRASLGPWLELTLGSLVGAR